MIQKLQVRTMTINVGLKTGARFKAVVRNSKTHEITKETPWIDNLVLNSGLTRMGQGTWIDRCCVGTGTAEPLVTDVGLTNFKAASTSRVGASSGRNTSGAEYFRWVRLRYRFNTGAATGLISEVGLGWNNANLWNKVLLKDTLGDVAPIIVLEDDYLDIIAEVRFFVSVPNPTGTINLLNKDNSIRSTHNYNIVPSYGANFVGLDFYALVANLETYSGGVINSLNPPTGNLLSLDINPIVPTTIRSSLISFNQGLTQANAAQKTLVLAITDATPYYYGSTYMSGFQIELDPPIVKSDTQVLQHNFLLSWDRI